MEVKEKGRKEREIDNSIVAALDSILDMITCKYFKRREIKSQKIFDVSQIIESTFDSICTSACTTKLVSFSCENAV